MGQSRSDLDSWLRQIGVLIPCEFPAPEIGCDLEVEDEPPGFFIPPDLTQVLSSSGKQPSIVIVSASGAVGKSTLARSLSNRCKIPLLKLNALETGVGHASFRGAVVSCYPTKSYSEITDTISKGDILFLIDALDEGRVKTNNDPSFFGFIDEIGRLSKASPRPTFILFGRTQSADDCWEQLSNSGLNVDLYQILPFSQAQRLAYIDQYMLHEAPKPAAANVKSHRANFESARDLIFSRLGEALSTSGDGVPATEQEEFLGYAPVVDAVAVLLAGDKRNFSSILKGSLADRKSRPDAPSEDAFTVLRGVVEFILERERNDKFGRQVRTALEPLAGTWKKWDTLYSPSEQVSRILCLVSGEYYIPSILDAPNNLQLKYEESVNEQLPTHPFVRNEKSFTNAVFEAYVLAFVCVSDDEFLAMIARKRMASQSFKFSRLFADFYFDIITSMGQSTINVEDFPFLYDSFAAGETDRLRVRMELEGPDPEDVDLAGSDIACECEFALIASKPDGLASHGDALEKRGSFTYLKKSFSVSISNNTRFHFRRRVKNSVITVPCEIVFGDSSSDEYLLGPAVDVRCRKLVIRTKRLVVGSGTQEERKDGSEVVLSTLDCVDESVILEPKLYGNLSVSWPNSKRFPWTRYTAEDESRFNYNFKIWKSYLRFRRIVMTLRAYGKENLARVKDKVEHERVSRGPLGKALLAQLSADNILRLEGNFYHWNQEVADKMVGIGWFQLRNREVSDKLKAYLEQFVNDNENAFDWNRA